MGSAHAARHKSGNRLDSIRLKIEERHRFSPVRKQFHFGTKPLHQISALKVPPRTADHAYVVPGVRGSRPSLIFRPRRCNMAVEGIGNLVQSLADHLFGQAPATSAGAQIPGVPVAGATTATEDTFTSSAQDLAAQSAAQAAGIFQLSPGAVTAVAPATCSRRRLPISSRLQRRRAAIQQVRRRQQRNRPRPHPPMQAPTPATQPGEAAPDPQLLRKYKTRFSSSTPLSRRFGLTNTEIQEIDRIASLIKNFNPAAYTDLVNQFEARSQAGTQNSGTTSLGSAAISGSGTADQNAAGFQPQQILGPPATSQSASNSPQTGDDPNALTNPNAGLPPAAQTEGAQSTPANPGGQSGQAPRLSH